MTEFTINQVSKHNKKNDCWIVIYDEVYDITNFMKNEHSGGFVPLSVAGKDATNLFIATHPSYVKKLLNSDSNFYKKYHVGTIARKQRSLSDDTLYFELKKEVEEYMLKKNMKARDIPLFEFEMVAFLLLTVFTYTKILRSKHSLISSILHGISFSFLITRTIHDCNHGGLTKSKRWKRYLFTFINEIITTNQSWQSKHNLHHMHTNDIKKDPDVYSNAHIVRLSANYEIKMHHKFQFLYWMFLYPLFILSQIVGLTHRSDNDPEPTHKMSRYFAKMILVWWIHTSFKHRKLHYWVFAMLLSGFYLTTVFSVNHALYYLSDDYRNTRTFLEEQLSSTSDYSPGSKFVNLITHGLNHQTIHHLFPSISYHNYPTLTEEVLIPFCKKHHLKYHGENDTFFKLFCNHIYSLYRWRK